MARLRPHAKTSAEEEGPSLPRWRLDLCDGVTEGARVFLRLVFFLGGAGVVNSPGIELVWERRSPQRAGVRFILDDGVAIEPAASLRGAPKQDSAANRFKGAAGSAPRAACFEQDARLRKRNDLWTFRFSFGP